MKKLLATLLALSLILGSLFTGMVSVSAATFTPVVSEDTENYGLVPYPMDTYAAVVNYKGYGNQLADYPYASIDKIGVDGTNGLKIEGEGKDIESYIRLGNGANFLDPATKYVLEFQVKSTVNLDETEEGYLEYGVFSAWKSDNREVYSFEEANVWETVSYTFVPSVNDSGVTGHCHVALLYNIPVGETLYFDNFALYSVTETKDESGNVTSSTVNSDVNLFDRVKSGSKFQTNGYAGSNRGSFDCYEASSVIETPIDGTAVPIAKTDIPAFDFTKYPYIPSHTSFDSIISINAGDGVNGTAGMKFATTGGAIKSVHLGLGEEGEQYGTKAQYFAYDKTFYLSFKAKKVGTVSDFSIDLFRVSGSTNKFIAVELTDEWVEYKAAITVTKADCYISGTSYRVGVSNLIVNCNVADGSYLYIDDIELCRKDLPANVLYWGDFDKYILDSVDDSALEGVTYEPYPLYYSTKGTYNDNAAVSPSSNAAGTIPVTDGHLSVSELGEGVRDSYAMVLTGTGSEVINSAVIGQDTILYGNTYEVSFKAKTSENAMLTKLNVGMKQRWSWNAFTNSTNNNITNYSWTYNQNHNNVVLGLTFADETGVKDITTDWQEFTFRITPNLHNDDSYMALYLNYILNEGEKLYIDDVEIYEVGGDGVNLFPNGTFGRIKSVEAIDAGDEIGLYSAKWLDEYDYYEYTYETDEQGNENQYAVCSHKEDTCDCITDENGVKFVILDGNKVVVTEGGKKYCTSKTLVTDYHFNAYAMPSSLALSGKHVLAAGGLDNNSQPVNGRVGFEMTGIAPGKTYKVSFSLLLFGEISFAATGKDSELTVNISDGGEGTEKAVLVTRKSGIATGAGSKRYLEYGSELWQDYEFYFTSEAESIKSWPSFIFRMKGAAGSGFLLDNVSVQQVLPDGSLAGNQFYCEGFEIPETPDADFSSNKFWGTDVSDLSFMNELPFAIDVMGVTSTQRPDMYADIMRDDSDFAFANTVIINNSALDVIRYEAEVANKLGKEIWINADIFASEKGALSTGNWKELLTAAANIVQNIAGDNFQGFYFDEPHYHYASNEEFVTVTKFLRETFKKRVFAMNKHDSFNLEGNANVKITPESHAYVTDVGYWNYSLDGIQTRVDGFNTAYARLNKDTRAWFACLLGSEPTYNEDGSVNEDSINTEAEVIEIFNTMLAGINGNDSFGGIMLYSTGATNGYDEIKLGEDGKAEYNTYRNILVSLAAEEKGEVIGTDGFVANADGILTVSSAKTVADIIAAYNAVYTNVQIKDGEAVLEATDSINKTGLEIFVDSKMGKALSTAIAYENDVNGDADTNVLDLVRLKKIAGGLEATAAQYAAAGSTVAEGIDADNLTQYRQFLLGE